MAYRSRLGMVSDNRWTPLIQRIKVRAMPSDDTEPTALDTFFEDLGVSVLQWGPPVLFLLLGWLLVHGFRAGDRNKRRA